jgi:tetratricopeptide (TPR) repeat protein
MRSLSVLFAFTALVSAAAPLAGAAADAEVRVTAPFWRAVAEPGFRRSRLLLREAITDLDQAERRLPGGWQSLCRRIVTIPLAAENERIRAGRERALRQLVPAALKRRFFLDRALDRLRRAAQAAAGDPEVLFVLARALSLWEEPLPELSCTARRRDAEAIDAYRRLRRIDPGYRGDRVAFQLGILLTRTRKYALAAGEYRRAIALSLEPVHTAVAHSNLAEVTMLAGDPAGAVEHYRRAIALSRDDRDYLLARWGLSVALDRLGEHGPALQEASRAVRAGGGSLHVLRSEGVFYEPDYEVHYYEALGHEALSLEPDAIVENALDLAARSWQIFIDKAGEGSMWFDTAAANLENARRRLSAHRREMKRKGRRTRAARRGKGNRPKGPR